MHWLKGLLPLLVVVVVLTMSLLLVRIDGQPGNAINATKSDEVKKVQENKEEAVFAEKDINQFFPETLMGIPVMTGGTNLEPGKKAHPASPTLNLSYNESYMTDYMTKDKTIGLIYISFFPNQDITTDIGDIIRQTDGVSENVPLSLAVPALAMYYPSAARGKPIVEIHLLFPKAHGMVVLSCYGQCSRDDTVQIAKSYIDTLANASTQYIKKEKIFTLAEYDAKMATFHKQKEIITVPRIIN